MTCRTCGTEIADRALICYRCGTATTEPTFKPATSKRSPMVLAVVLIALALLIGVAFLVLR